jgi:hypothetical protein
VESFVRFFSSFEQANQGFVVHGALLSKRRTKAKGVTAGAVTPSKIWSPTR